MDSVFVFSPQDYRRDPDKRAGPASPPSAAKHLVFVK
jgi:hypothetical protein